jgi:16S rRNA (cytosine967-C5)-methyltransferase
VIQRGKSLSFDARKSALDILNTLDGGHQTLDAVLEEFSSGNIEVPRRERALLQALVYGVLRWRGRLDFLISHFSSTRFDKINPKVLNILRLALFQIVYLDRIPDSAAVNTAVELAKASGAPWVVRYVNALLRSAVREYQNVSFPQVGKNAMSALAGEKSFPEWIVSRWLDRYGPQDTAALCDSINAIPPITVRTNTLKISRRQLMEALANEAEQIKPTAYSPDGITLINPIAAIPELSAFKAGWFQVQDEAAQLVSMLLNPQPGESVLDACAGLGGKTGHIAQMMKNEGTVAALDVSAGKLLRLQAEVQRLGITIVSTFCHDLEREIPQDRLPGFDRILLDAPCSGLGVIRRNPDIKWRTSKKNLLAFKARQIRLLTNLARLVKPSGILVYAVCSPEPEENEEVINEFLKNHSGFVINKEFGQLPEKLCAMAESRGIFKTFPHSGQMDGFFSIRLQRIQ